MKLLTKKALLQRNASRQNRLDQVVTGHTVLGHGHIVPKSNPLPTPNIVLSQQFVPASSGRSEEPAKQKSKATTSHARARLSRPTNSATNSRPVQRPYLNTSRRVTGDSEAKPDLQGVELRIQRSLQRISRLFDEGHRDFARLLSVANEDVTLVAIDTESRRIGLLRQVSEIGISTLKLKDIFNSIEPGPYATNWISHIQHEHIVVSDRISKRNPRPSLFVESTLLTAAQAKQRVLQILQKRRIALVGHSLSADLLMLRRTSGLDFDLLKSGATDVDVVAQFDTYTLGQESRLAGAFLPGLSLSCLARDLGINPKYLVDRRIRGWHNASNDAAYTMMVLLLFLCQGRNLKDGNKSNEYSNNLRSMINNIRKRWEAWIRGSTS